MYAQVVVLTYQAPNVDSYSYTIPKELNKEIKIGQLVGVPFGRRNPQGIVLEIHNRKPKVKTKPITKILFSHPILLPYQIKLLNWMSKYYLAPLVNCLNAMLPHIPKRFSDYELTWGNKIQSLVITPTINRIPETLAKFPKAKNHTVYHNEMKMSDRFKTWLKILGGNNDYVFGSRATIFAPFPSLRDIIIYDEHDGAYKDQRSPYFDTLTITQKISSLTEAQIKIVDSSPKITTFHQLPNRIKKQDFSIKTKIVSLTDEKLRGNFSPISTYLHPQLSTNKNILLFLNKKKESGNLFCKECKYNDFFEKQPESCPKCKSRDIYFNVLNIDSLKTEVKKLSSNKNIDVATATIFYSPILKKYDLAVYIQPDGLINRTDFSATELLYSQIVSLKKTLVNNGLLLIQSFYPDDPILKTAAHDQYNIFYSAQIKNRQLLTYPPFALLIKLTIKGQKAQKIASLAAITAADIKDQTHALPVEVLGPFESIFFSSQPSFNIIIKYKLNSYDLDERFKAIQILSPLLKEIDKKIQIVIEPVSLN